jgi:hypothetical protein
MRIRSLEGFDEAALRAARDAEQRCEPGSFVVWRSQDDHMAAPADDCGAGS